MRWWVVEYFGKSALKISQLILRGEVTPAAHFGESCMRRVLQGHHLLLGLVYSLELSDSQEIPLFQTAMCLNLMTKGWWQKGWLNALQNLLRTSSCRKPLALSNKDCMYNVFVMIWTVFLLECELGNCVHNHYSFQASQNQ